MRFITSLILIFSLNPCYSDIYMSNQVYLKNDRCRYISESSLIASIILYESNLIDQTLFEKIQTNAIKIKNKVLKNLSIEDNAAYEDDVHQLVYVKFEDRDNLNNEIANTDYILERLEECRRDL